MHFSIQHAKKDLFIILILIVLLGTAYSYFLGDLFRFTDEKEYYTIAQNIVQKGAITINGTDLSAWRPPGYPVWLSLFIFFGSNIFILRLVNFALLSFSVLLIYKILEKQSKGAALIGAILMAFYPLFFFTASTLYPQTFVMTLFLLTLYLLFKEQEVSYKKALWIGMLYGALILSVVTFLGSLLITVFWISCVKKEGWKKALAMITATCLVLAPWTIRNYVVFDTFVFVANNGGIAFVLGNSKETEPNLGGNILLPEFDKEKVKTETEINAFYKSTAMEYIRAHKWASFKMYALKFLNYFNFTNTLMTKSEMSWSRDAVLFISYYFLLGLVFIRCMFWKKNPFSANDWYLIALYIGNGLLLALFITRIRYRLPYDPILVLLGVPLFATNKKS